MTTHEGYAVPTYLPCGHCRKLGVQVGCGRKEDRGHLVVVDFIGLHQLPQKLIGCLQNVIPGVLRHGDGTPYATTNRHLVHRSPRHIIATKLRNKGTRIFHQAFPRRLHENTYQGTSYNRRIGLLPDSLHMLPRRNAESHGKG